MSLVIAQSLSKTYATDSVQVKALQEVSFDIAAGSFLAFVGPSGSGKTTLLNLIGCLDKPTSGNLEVAGVDIVQLGRQQAAQFRGQNIGFIFQSFNLIPVLSAFENVEYPLVMVQERPLVERRSRVLKLLKAVGMLEQKDQMPEQLSGGQKQRVAIARALVTEPKLVLADEPTANLDHETAYMILRLMKQMRDDFGTTFIFSTHDTRIIGEAEIVCTLEDGRLCNGKKEAKLMFNLAKIAARNLRRYKRRSLLTVSLIAFGVVFVLVFVAVTASIKDFMIAQITDSYLGDLQIHRGGYVASIESLPLNLNLPPEGVSSIEKVLSGRKEIESYSERIKFGALFSNFTETTNIRINGVYPEKEFAALPQMLSRISEGEKSVRALEKGKILVPKLLAQGFGAKVGDTVVVVATNKDGSVNGKTFLVSGILESATGPGGRDGYINIRRCQRNPADIRQRSERDRGQRKIPGAGGRGCSEHPRRAWLRREKTKGGRHRGPYVVAALPLRQHRQHDRPDDLFYQADAHRDCLDQYSQRHDHGGL